MSLLKSRVAKLEQVLEAQQPPQWIVVQQMFEETREQAYARKGIDPDNLPPNTRVLLIVHEVVSGEDFVSDEG